MLKCAQCPFSAKDKSELSMHTFVKHKKDDSSTGKKRKISNSPQPSTSSDSKKAKIECPNCDFVAFEQSEMDLHGKDCQAQEQNEDVGAENSPEKDQIISNGPPTPKVEVSRQNFIKIRTLTIFFFRTAKSPLTGRPCMSVTYVDFRQSLKRR